MLSRHQLIPAPAEKFASPALCGAFGFLGFWVAVVLSSRRYWVRRDHAATRPGVWSSRLWISSA